MTSEDFELNTKNSQMQDNIEVFSTSDERLKILGQIFSNESSRKILTLLLEKELTIMNISNESGISANLIMHHLKKMINSNIVSVTRETTNSRGHPLRFYRAKPAIVILSKDSLRDAKTRKSLRNALANITRFSAVGIAGIFIWILTNSQTALESAFKYPRPTLPPYMNPIEPQLGVDFVSFLAVGVVVSAGITLSYFIPKLIKK